MNVVNTSRSIALVSCLLMGISLDANAAELDPGSKAKPFDTGSRERSSRAGVLPFCACHPKPGRSTCNVFFWH